MVLHILDSIRTSFHKIRHSKVQKESSIEKILNEIRGKIEKLRESTALLKSMASDDNEKGKELIAKNEEIQNYLCSLHHEYFILHVKSGASETAKSFAKMRVSGKMTAKEYVDNMYDVMAKFSHIHIMYPAWLRSAKIEAEMDKIRLGIRNSAVDQIETETQSMLAHISPISNRVLLDRIASIFDDDTSISDNMEKLNHEYERFIAETEI